MGHKLDICAIWSQARRLRHRCHKRDACAIGVERLSHLGMGCVRHGLTSYNRIIFFAVDASDFNQPLAKKSGKLFFTVPALNKWHILPNCCKYFFIVSNVKFLKRFTLYLLLAFFDLY